MNKIKSIFINLDGTVIDIAKNIPTQSTYLLKCIYNQIESKQNSETLFANAQPIPKAINAIEQLNKHYNLVFYCTYPWNNIYAYPQIKLWIQKHLSFTEQRFMVIAKEKNIFADFLIVRKNYLNTNNSVDTYIPLFSKKYPTWQSILEVLL